MWTSLAVATFLLAAGAGGLGARGARRRENHAARVIGGEPAHIQQFPWQVAIYHKTESFKGSGSIISHNWVLTAAKVLQIDKGNFFSAEDIALRVGSTFWTINGTVYEAEEVRIHKYPYSPLQANDVALVKVRGWISMGDHIKFLWLSTQLPEAGTTLTISGWGEVQPYIYPFDLRYKNVTLMDDEWCHQHYNKEYPWTDQICTRTEGARMGPNEGDTGGPLVANFTQYGIYFYTSIDGGGDDDDYDDDDDDDHQYHLKNYTHVYISIPPVRSWIFHNTGV